MKIIHIAAGLQETCGVSQFVVNIARAQQAAGHEVVIITSMTCGYPVNGLTVVLAAEPLRPLAKILGEDKTDCPDKVIVHIHSMWNPFVHKAAKWCREKGVRYVISPHGSATPWAMHYKWWKKIPAWWIYQRQDFGGAAAFHATVPEEEDDIRRLGFKQPVVIAPLGADVDTSEPNSSAVEGVRDVLFLSRIHPKKNIPSLIRAWAAVQRSKSGYEGQSKRRLIIAGSNDVGIQDSLVDLAKSLGLRVVDFSHELEYGKKSPDGGGEVPLSTFRKRLAQCEADVVFTGPVYSVAKDWMFAHAWVSVLPSHSENFGFVVVESLAHGTPVIASTGTPWQELEGGTTGRNGNASGCCGWWVDATPDKLEGVLVAALNMSHEERDKMSACARKLVAEKYSWKASAKKLLNTYQVI